MLSLFLEELLRRITNKGLDYSLLKRYGWILQEIKDAKTACYRKHCNKKQEIKLLRVIKIGGVHKLLKAASDEPLHYLPSGVPVSFKHLISRAVMTVASGFQNKRVENMLCKNCHYEIFRVNVRCSLD